MKLRILGLLCAVVLFAIAAEERKDERKDRPHSAIAKAGAIRRPQLLQQAVQKMAKVEARSQAVGDKASSISNGITAKPLKKKKSKGGKNSSKKPRKSKKSKLPKPEASAKQHKAPVVALAEKSSSARVHRSPVTPPSIQKVQVSSSLRPRVLVSEAPSGLKLPVGKSGTVSESLSSSPSKNHEKPSRKEPIKLSYPSKKAEPHEERKHRYLITEHEMHNLYLRASAYIMLRNITTHALTPLRAEEIIEPNNLKYHYHAIDLVVMAKNATGYLSDPRIVGVSFENVPLVLGQLKSRDANPNIRISSLL